MSRLLHLRRLWKWLGPQSFSYRLQADAVGVRGHLATALEPLSREWRVTWDGMSVSAVRRGFLATRFDGRVKSLPSACEVVGHFRPNALGRIVCTLYGLCLAPFLLVSLLAPAIAVVAALHGHYLRASLVLTVPLFVAFHAACFIRLTGMRAAGAEERLMRTLVDTLDRV